MGFAFRQAGVDEEDVVFVEELVEVLDGPRDEVLVVEEGASVEQIEGRFRGRFFRKVGRQCAETESVPNVCIYLNS